MLLEVVFVEKGDVALLAHAKVFLRGSVNGVCKGQH